MPLKGRENPLLCIWYRDLMVFTAHESSAVSVPTSQSGGYIHAYSIFSNQMSHQIYGDLDFTPVLIPNSFNLDFNF